MKLTKRVRRRQARLNRRNKKRYFDLSLDMDALIEKVRQQFNAHTHITFSFTIPMKRPSISFIWENLQKEDANVELCD